MLNLMSGEKRIARVVGFFDKLLGELERGISECHEKNLSLHKTANDLVERANETRERAREVGLHIGKAFRLRTALKNLLNETTEPEQNG